MDRMAGLADQSVSFAAYTTATGAAATVTSATAGLALWYRRGVTGAKVAITPIGDLATLETAHTDKAILVIGGAEHRLDLPDAAFVAGATYLEWGGEATGITIDGGHANLIGQANTATDTTQLAGQTVTAAGAVTFNANVGAAAAPGAANGMLIAGENAATTFAALECTGALTIGDGISVSCSTLNRSALTLTGNGTGYGLIATGGENASGIYVAGGANGAYGFEIVGTGAQALQLTGGAASEGLRITVGAGGTHSVTIGAVSINGVTVTFPASVGTSTLDSTQAQAAAVAALVTVNLDHLVGTATDIPSLPAGTWLDTILNDGTSAYNRTTDSLQAIRDRGDISWITGWNTAQVTAVTTMASRFNTMIVLNGAVYDFTAAALASVSKTGYSLAATGLDAIADPDDLTPGTVPATFTQKLRWLIQRFWKADKSASAIAVKNEAGQTITSQATTSSGNDQTLGAPA